MKLKRYLSLFLSALAVCLTVSPARSGAYEELGGAGREPAALTRASEPSGGDSRKEAWLSLASFKGSTFMQFLTAPNGLKAALDRDGAAPFNFAPKENLIRAAADFDPAVYAKLYKSVEGGPDGAARLAESLAGERATPVTAAGIIAGKLKSLNLCQSSRIGLTAVIFAPVFALVSGAGVPVMLDQQNYFYNVGYRSGANPAEMEKDVKSGRSYGVSRAHKPLDVSDRYYLEELHRHLFTAGDAAPFYRAMMRILTASDPSGLAALPPPAQAVLTDFTAVYAAELDRYAMTGFKKHPWQNDLAEATLISAFSSPAQRVVENGRLVQGDPIKFFGVGMNGSGIGITRRDRRTLQLTVSDFERQRHPELVAEVETLIGRQGGDVFHNVMLFINRADGQAKVQAASGRLSEAVAALAAQVYADAPEITRFIVEKGLAQQNDADSHSETTGTEPAARYDGAVLAY